MQFIKYYETLKMHELKKKNLNKRKRKNKINMELIVLSSACIEGIQNR